MARKKGCVKKVCACMGEGFYVEPDEQWKTICPKCYKKYYLPIQHLYKQKTIQHMWGWILEKHFRMTRDGFLVRRCDLPTDDTFGNGVEVYWTGTDYDYR